MINKIKNAVTKGKLKIAMAIGSASAILGTASTAYCADTDTGFKEGITTIFNQVTADINIGTIVAIIGIVIGSAVGLYLFWYGLRYVIRKIKAALKGKLSA